MEAAATKDPSADLKEVLLHSLHMSSLSMLNATRQAMHQIETLEKRPFCIALSAMAMLRQNKTGEHTQVVVQEALQLMRTAASMATDRILFRTLFMLSRGLELAGETGAALQTVMRALQLLEDYERWGFDYHGAANGEAGGRANVPVPSAWKPRARMPKS